VNDWKACFRLARTPEVFRCLDEWLRYRLRALQLAHWKWGKTMCRELKALGATGEVARRIAVMPIAFFDQLGVPRHS